MIVENIYKNFKELENLVATKFGLEHPYTITFFQQSETIQDIIKKHKKTDIDKFCVAFNEMYFTELKNIILNDYKASINNY